MPRGYTPARLERAGAGANEVWTAVLREHERRGAAGEPWPVAEVRQVYDRSAYLEFDPAALGEADLLGPPLVLLAGPGFDGPLATVVETDGVASFPAENLTRGASCRLRTAAGASTPLRYALAVGQTLDLEIDPRGLDADSPDPDQRGELSDIARDGAVWRRAAATLDLLDEHGFEDGLGWLPELHRLVDGGDPDAELRALVDGWAALLESPVGSVETPTTVLGRGPGATPSGDDVLSGLLLGLYRTTRSDRRRRVRWAGERVVAAAGGRTTTVSRALLAQAAQGRAAGSIEAALRAIFDSNGHEVEFESTVLTAAERGHTSGVDLLLGLLLVPLAIGPRLAEP